MVLSKSKKTLGIVFVFIVFLAIISISAYLVVYKDKKEQDPAIGAIDQSYITPPELPEEYSTIDNLYKYYENKDYEQVIKSATEYSKNVSNQSHLRVVALSLCLDAAVNIQNADSREYCYTNALKLLEDEPDQITKAEMTKSINSIYNGTDNTDTLKQDENYE